MWVVVSEVNADALGQGQENWSVAVVAVRGRLGGRISRNIVEIFGRGFNDIPLSTLY